MPFKKVKFSFCSVGRLNNERFSVRSPDGTFCTLRMVNPCEHDLPCPSASNLSVLLEAGVEIKETNTALIDGFDSTRIRFSTKKENPDEENS